MQIGAIIENGLADWQIIQQIDGKGTINLTGCWRHTDDIKDPIVLVRIVNEETFDVVIPWVRSEMMENQKWNITIQNIPVGGLYRVETCLSPLVNPAVEWSTRGDMIHHIGIGDLYVIAGQSNSAGYGKDPIFDPPELGIHLFKNSGKWDLASHPMNESTNTIHEENREGANPGHSPYLAFAKMLKRELGYPIGLVQAALGGSPLSAWNPDEDGILYKSMLKTITSLNCGIKGLLWYQGCSDTSEVLCDTYLERFKNMVSRLRIDLKNPELPVLTVQLSRLVAPSDQKSDIFWSTIREAQRQAAKQVQNVYVIPSIDSTLSDLIHISSASNMVLGQRLAKVALNKIYNKNILSQGPDFELASLISSSEIILKFTNVNDKIYTFDVAASLLPFTIEDASGDVKITSYTQNDPACICLKLERAIEGKCVVHGLYGQNPAGVIPVDFSTHLPILCFYNAEVKL